MAAPSANRSGKPSCTTWKSVQEDFVGRIDAILAYDCQGCGLESTVVDCTGEKARVLRPGAITEQMLLDANIPMVDDHIASGHGVEPVLSPGTRYPHYQPQACVILLESEQCLHRQSHEINLKCATYAGIGPVPQSSKFLLCREFPDIDEYAKNFYEFLRTSDRLGAQYILLQLTATSGIGGALRDRQLRAASNYVTDS